MRIPSDRLGISRGPGPALDPLVSPPRAPAVGSDAPVAELPRVQRLEVAPVRGWARVLELLRAGAAPAVQAVSLGVSFFAPTVARGAVVTPQVPLDEVTTDAEALLFAAERAAARSEWRSNLAFRDLDGPTQDRFIALYARLSPEAQATVRQARPRATQTVYLELLSQTRLAERPREQQHGVVQVLGTLSKAALEHLATTPKLWPLAESPGFAALITPVRERMVAAAGGLDDLRLRAVAKELDRWPTPTWHSALIVEVVAAPAFAALPEATALRLLRYIGGTNVEMSGPARRGFDRLVRSDEFRALPLADQVTALETHLVQQPWLMGVLDAPPALPVRTEVALDAGAPVAEATLTTGVAPATRHTLTLDGRAVDLHVAHGAPEAGLHQATAEELRDAISRMPAAARARLQHVQLSVLRSPVDAHWATVFGQPAFRAAMTADSAGGVLTIFPTHSKQSVEQLASSLTHEAGHFDAHARWGADETKAAWAPWRAVMKADELEPSGYARGNADEDYAESYRLYFQVKGTPAEAEVRELLPARFALLDALHTGP